MSECNAEDGRPQSCDAIDGDHCAECQKTLDDAMAEGLRSYRLASPKEKNRKAYIADMMGAGRAHLLSDEELSEYYE